MDCGYLLAQGNAQQAKPLYLQAYQSFKTLTEREPDNAQWQGDLSLSYEKLADVYLAAGILSLVILRPWDTASKQKPNKRSRQIGMIVAAIMLSTWWLGGFYITHYVRVLLYPQRSKARKPARFLIAYLAFFPLKKSKQTSQTG